MSISSLLRRGCRGLLLLLAGPALAQQPPAAAPRVVSLDSVLVRPPRVRVLRLPGATKGAFGELAYSLGPTRRVALWFALPPDSAYRVRAVRLQLAARLPEHVADLARHRRHFPEGRLAVWLVPATATGQPADSSLLPAPLLLTPTAPAADRQGRVRLELPGPALVLPPGGVFVVVEGLPNPGERFVRSRSLLHPPDAGHPPQDYIPRPGTSQRVYRYEEVQAADSPTPRLVLTSDYPALVQQQVATPAECRTWLYQAPRTGPGSWLALAALHAQFRQQRPQVPLHDYNHALELEVEVP